MAVAIDFSKASAAIILDLINGSQTPPATLTAADITLGVPSANATDPETTGDTAVVVTGVLAEGYKGSVTVTYNRVPITAVVGANSDEFEVGSATNVSDLLAQINARFGINLTAAEITDAALPDVTGGAASFDLVIAASCLVYSGTLSLTLVPNATELNTVITTPALDGLDYPAA